MAYRVEITASAERDLTDAVAYIAQDSIDAAIKWHSEIDAVFLSLQELPTRFAVISEADVLGVSYRSVIHYSHRVVFRIDDEKQVVYIVRVYHGARRPLAAADIEAPPDSPH